MPINKNHLFDELDGKKCAVVETEMLQARVNFLKPLLEFNGYEVVVVPTPPPKVPPKIAEGETPPEAPPTFTMGVTNVMFNVTNALYGRFLRTPDGHIITPAYWLQQEALPNDEVPYFEKQLDKAN